MRIYTDNAATTQMSRAAIDSMLQYMDKEYGNPSSLHTMGQRASEALQSARETVAQQLGCTSREIYFTSGGSESDNQAILSAAAVGMAKGKKHIISTAFEHHAVLHVLKKLEREGFEITLLDVHKNGIVIPQELEAALRDNTCLVTVMYANNEIGTIQPIPEIGEICRKHGIIFHTDAVQAVGHIPIDVNKQSIDMLSLSAHKFHGPKGIGALYVRKGINLKVLIEGGAQERGKRAGTENIPAIMGMAVALREACSRMAEHESKLIELRNRLIDSLKAVPHSVLNGDKASRLPGNVSFCFEGIEGEALLLLLDQQGICASSGSACTSGALEPSHVLLAIGHPHELAHGSLRLTLSDYNTDEEIIHIINTVPKVVEHLRSMSPLWKDMQEGKKAHVIQ